MPLFLPRKNLVTGGGVLSVEDATRRVPGLGVDWDLQMRNAYGPELITDGDMELPQYGADLVENGTFDPVYGPELYVTPNAASDPAGNEADATTGWISTDSTFTSDSTIKSTGSYSLKTVPTGNVGRSNFDLDTILTDGLRYKISFNARHLGTGGINTVSIGATQSSSTTTIATLDNTDIVFVPYSIEFTHDAESRWLIVRELSGTNDGGVYIDNISIVEVNPEWDLGEDYVYVTGDELVTNGDFATDTDWTKGTGWTIAAGVASCDGTQVATTELVSSDAVVAGATYDFTYTISDYVAGDFIAILGNVAGTARSANGTYTEQIIASNTANIRVRTTSTGNGDIDDVSVKEVVLGTPWSIGSALEQLSEDGDGTADAGNWSAGSGATLTNPSINVLQVGCAIADNQSDARQSNDLINGKQYRVTGICVGDGVNGKPILSDGITLLFTGTISNVDQNIDETFTANGTTVTLITSGDVATSDTTQWRNLSVKEVATAHCDGTQSAVSNLAQSATIDEGKTYLVAFTVSNYSAGSVRGKLQAAAGSYVSANGSYTQNIIAGAGTPTAGVQGDSTFVGDIDNVVVREVITLTNWEVSSVNVTLTKDLVNPYEGLQSLRVENLSGVPNSINAVQSPLVTDKRYLVTGHAVSDGSEIPRINNPILGDLWTGVDTHTDWQEFDFEVTAGSGFNSDQLRFGVGFAANNGLVKFDAISVVELIPEGGGSVAYAYNPALDLGRNVAPRLFADYTVTNGGWSDGGSEIAHCDGTQLGTTVLQSPELPKAAIGEIYTVTVTISNYVAGNLTMQLFATNGTSRSSNGEFIEDLVVATGGKLNITADVNFEGDVNLKILSVQQTDIAKSGDFPGAELLNEDGASGTATAGNWVAENGAALSNPIINNLRIEYSGVTSPKARQIFLTVGVRYRVVAQGFAVGGTTIPRIDMGGTVIVDGVASSDWQFFDKEFVADDTKFRLNSQNAGGAGQYTQWRNISVTLANPLNGKVVAADIGQDAGVLGVAVDFDPAFSHITVLSTELNSILNLLEGGVGAFVDPDDAAWLDSTLRVIVHFYIDANNFILIAKAPEDNSIFMQVMMGGTDRSVTIDIGTCAGLGFIHTFLTWGENAVIAWINGYAVAVLGGVGEGEGNLTIAEIGGLNPTPNSAFDGLITRVPLYVLEPSAADVKSIAASGGTTMCGDVTLSGVRAFSSAFSSAFG